MRGYVIVRDDGCFVADMRKSRTGGSYTSSLQYAKVYDTAETADCNRCPGNEYVRSIDDIMR